MPEKNFTGQNDLPNPPPKTLEVPPCPTYRSIDISEDIVSDHGRFLLSLSTSGEESSAEILSRAQLEMEAITKMFPNKISGRTLLGMAAWLSYNFTMDDIVEGMPGHQARQALVEIFGVFYAAIDPGEETIWGDSATNKLSRASWCLRRRLEACVPELAIPAVFRQIRLVLLAHTEESHLRTIHPQSLDDYLSVRFRTIGVSPWFSMLGVPDTAVPSTEPEIAMANLKDLVSKAVSLQNDIVGLERDLENGESMNFVLIYQKQFQRPTASFPATSLEHYRDGIYTAVDQHNIISRQAEVSYRKLSEVGSSEDKIQAQTLYFLIATHFDWASDASRYRVGTQNTIK